MLPQAHSTQAADVICVGSGITALAFGALIVQRNPAAKVLIVEKHTAPGGYATIFRRKNTRFDCSLHKLSGMGKTGNLRRIFAELGLLDELDVVAPQAFFEACMGDRRLTLSNDYEVFKAQLGREFSDDKVGLAQVFADLEVHGKNGYYQYQILDGTYFPEFRDLRYAHKNLSRISAGQALEQRLCSPMLRELIATPSVYVGGFPEDLSYLYYLHALYATLCCGNAYVRGGAQYLSDRLVDRIRQAGGDVLLRTEVKRILVDEHDRVRGVETNRGTFMAPQVFVNASPHYALQTLLPDLACLEPVKKILSELKPSWSTTTSYLVTDRPPEELGFEHSEMMILPDSPDVSRELRRQVVADPRDQGLAERTLWQECTMEVTNYHKLDASGGHALCINVLDTMAQWPARKTAAYWQKKERASQVLLERLLRYQPSLAGHVVYQDLSSPRTYQRYTNNHAGAGYGGLVGTSGAAHTFHHRFPVGGLHFMSSWVAGSGYEAAFGYAEARAKRYA